MAATNQQSPSNMRNRAIWKANRRRTVLVAKIMAEVEGIRRALGTRQSRLWRCGFSEYELIEFNKEPTGQVGPRPLLEWEGPEAKDEIYGEFKEMTGNEGRRWKRVIEGQPANFDIKTPPYWEADIVSLHGNRRVAAICAFDKDHSQPTRKEEADQRLLELAKLFDDYLIVIHELQTLVLFDPKLLNGLLGPGGKPLGTSGATAGADSEASYFASEIDAWVKDLHAAADLRKEDDCAVIVRVLDDNREYKMFYASQWYANAIEALPGELKKHFVLAGESEEDSIIGFACKSYDPSAPKWSMLFPRGTDQPASFAAVLTGLRRRIDDEASATTPAEVAATQRISQFFAACASSGSFGVFPIVRQVKTIEGFLVIYSGRRTFFNPINTALLETMARKLGQLGGLLPDHAAEKALRCGRFGLIYGESIQHEPSSGSAPRTNDDRLPGRELPSHHDSQRRRTAPSRFSSPSQALWPQLLGNRLVHAVVFFDMDKFKRVNDTWGHHVGDEFIHEIMLALIASACGQNDKEFEDWLAGDGADNEISKVRKDEHASTSLAKARCIDKNLVFIPIHYGGDEFGMVFLGDDHLTDADPRKEVIKRKVYRTLSGITRWLRQKYASLVGDGSQISLSGGLAYATPEVVAQCLGEGTSVYKKLRGMADDYMYLAKGLEKIMVFSPGVTVEECRLVLERLVRMPNVWLAREDAKSTEAPRLGMTLSVDKAELLRDMKSVQVEQGTPSELLKKSLPTMTFEVMSAYDTGELGVYKWLVRAQGPQDAILPRRKDVIRCYVGKDERA